jgi:beta-lactamase regulating signal transducer with metallopeptidase domain
MTLVMAYVILIAAGISASAVVVEAIVRGRGFATRWVWVGALGLTTAATMFAMIVPKRTQAVEASVISEPTEAPVLPVMSTLESARVPDLTPIIGKADLALPVAWLLATSVLLIALGAGQQRYRRERARAKAARVGGHEVLLTEDVGPAVAGVRRPVVFVPRWVLALDESSQQLLLSHELEHVKERDTWLLLYGAVSVAVTPWNPVVWWMVRRLRLAVEQDCDARVLARHPGIRRYADLLLTAASRHGLTARLLAAHFGEYTSDLVRRIEAMTNVKELSWRRIGGAAIVATALIAVACETPRPDPVAPIALEKAAPISNARSAEFVAIVDRCTSAGGAGCSLTAIVKSSDGKELRRYEGEIPVAEIPVGIIRQINVENAKCGASDCSLVWITLKPDVSLPQAELEQKRAGSLEGTLARTREVLDEFERLENKLVPLINDSSPPSAIDERRVASRGALVELNKQAPVLVSGSYLERDGERVGIGKGTIALPPKVLMRSGAASPEIVLRSGSRNTASPLVIVDGIIMSGTLDDIDPKSIEIIEVFKGAAATRTYGDRAKDGVIQITTKGARRVP